jgi:dipeptidyl-peptidase-4
MSLLDGTRKQIARDVDGRTLGTLRSVAEQPPFIPRIEVTTVGRDPSFNAVVVRPRNFDGGRRYPVIVSVYGGPHSQTATSGAWSYLLQQWIADHGFVVVSIDGRGTPSRGRDWERAIKGNLIATPLDDQVAGLYALARKYTELDIDRVGIYGWSFGGYFSAMAVMQRPDVFDVGVAGAPVADWLDYDTHYTERYMGLPDENPMGYEAASVLTYTSKLEKPLLIVHGTADDNVYFAHSLKMSNALFRAGKPHDFLALSDFTHMVADPLVTRRLYERIVGYLTEHLAAE